jgi:hypothetical protein
MRAKGFTGGNSERIVAYPQSSMTGLSVDDPDDQHEGQLPQRAHIRMRHRPQHFGLFLGFLFGESAGQNERSAYNQMGSLKFRQSAEPLTSPRLISIGKGNEDIPAPLTMSQ